MTLPETGGLPDGAVATSVTAAAAPPKGAAPGFHFTTTDYLLMLMSLIWAINIIVAKAAFAVFTPFEFNAFRFTIAGISVILVARFYSRAHPARADWPRLALLALLGITIYQVAFIEGLARTKAGNASLIMGTGQIYTALFSHWRGHEKIRGRDVAGIVASTLGLVSVVAGGTAELGFGEGLGGDLLMLFATICWAAYTVGNKPMVDRYGSIAATAWTMAIGAVPLVLLGAPEVLRHDLTTVPLSGWAAMLYSSLGALVVAFFIWYRGVEKIGSTRTAVYSNFQPVIVLLIAWPLLHETPTAWQLVGAGGIFTGIYLTRT